MTLYDPPSPPRPAPQTPASPPPAPAARKAHAEPDWPAAKAVIDQALREGRHSTSWQTICEGCGRWVPAIYHVTFDGKRICRRCSGDAQEDPT